MTGGRVYRLERIADLLLVPADRLDDCLTDLRMGLASARLVLAASPKPLDHRLVLQRVDWCDDDRRESTAHLGNGLQLTIRKDP